MRGFYKNVPETQHLSNFSITDDLKLIEEFGQNFRLFVA
ncbi:hypothetical protein SAMN05216474_2486 [Lishizhenia tianjinensis]|uniref:Uncharacterized protein n=1 Tax=Lishizhenia tianjinensis TaxID=477690 RepID=A0A1I7B2I6_9FLAO|nr:hypothetical protein SAMN05216474_2486 [Lishizhenia tianjinensis]